MRTRKSARGILVNKNNEILLIKFIQNKIKGEKELWVFPGGGLKTGESYEDACRRELLEELGIVVNEMKLVWNREILLDGKDQVINSIEYYFLIKVCNPKISLEGFTINEKNTFKGIKWWSLHELSESKENYTFQYLSQLCNDLLDNSLKYPIRIYDNEVVNR